MIFTTWILIIVLSSYFKPNVTNQLITLMNDPKNCMIVIMVYGFLSVICLLLDVYTMLVKINNNLSKGKEKNDERK